jgi:hypothetical protein
MIEAATAWRLAAEAEPGCNRKWLSTWLREERYEEDAPGGFAKPSSKPANRNTPKGRRTVEVVDSDIIGVGADEKLAVYFRDTDTGEEFNHGFTFDGEEVVGPDKSRYAALCKGAGCDPDGNPMVGAIVEIGQVRGRPQYHEAAEPAFAAAQPPGGSTSRDWRRGEVVATSVAEPSPLVQSMNATIKTADDTFVETFRLKHPNPDEQAHGEKQLAALCRAVGLVEIEDTDTLHGLPFEYRVNEGRYEYRALTQDVAA